jgi:hypothetical protein
VRRCYANLDEHAFERCDCVLVLLQKGAKNSKKQKVGSRLVTVELIEAWDLQPWDDNGKADPYVKLTIGNQKRKSKV